MIRLKTMGLLFFVLIAACPASAGSISTPPQHPADSLNMFLSAFQLSAGLTLQQLFARHPQTRAFKRMATTAHGVYYSRPLNDTTYNMQPGVTSYTMANDTITAITSTIAIQLKETASSLNNMFDTLGSRLQTLFGAGNVDYVATQYQKTWSLAHDHINYLLFIQYAPQLNNNCEAIYLTLNRKPR